MRFTIKDLVVLTTLMAALLGLVTTYKTYAARLEHSEAALVDAKRNITRLNILNADLERRILIMDESIRELKKRVRD